MTSLRALGGAFLLLVGLTGAGDPPTGWGQPLTPPAPTLLILQDGDIPDLTAEATTIPDSAEARDLAIAPQAAGSEQERCVAAAVYYESRGEPHAGQRAVAQVILNRVKSGRFARTPCGVVRQPGQFSFARRSFSPQANADWRKAEAIARAAMAGAREPQAEGALYFHANYVQPGWTRRSVAAIGRHVFYR